MLEITWAAGLFEGEGSIVRRKRGRRISLVLLLGTTDEDVARRFGSAVRVGSVNGPYQPGKSPAYKPYWQWSASGSSALELAFRPEFTSQLGERRRVKLAAIVTDVVTQASPLRSPLATHCPQSHPYDEENTLVNDRRHRRCRRCLRERARERYYANLEESRRYARERQRKKKLARLSPAADERVGR